MMCWGSLGSLVLKAIEVFLPPCDCLAQDLALITPREWPCVNKIVILDRLVLPEIHCYTLSSTNFVLVNDVMPLCVDELPENLASSTLIYWVGSMRLRLRVCTLDWCWRQSLRGHSLQFEGERLRWPNASAKHGLVFRRRFHQLHHDSLQVLREPHVSLWWAPT